MFSKTTPAQIYGDIFFYNFAFLWSYWRLWCSYSSVCVSFCTGKKYILFFIKNIIDKLEKREKHDCSA